MIGREREAYDAGRLAGFEEGMKLDVDRLSQAIALVMGVVDRGFAADVARQYERLSIKPDPPAVRLRERKP